MRNYEYRVKIIRHGFYPPFNVSALPLALGGGACASANYLFGMTPENIGNIYENKID
jgi:hypothetical protein